MMTFFVGKDIDLLEVKLENNFFIDLRTFDLFLDEYYATSQFYNKFTKIDFNDASV